MRNEAQLSIGKVAELAGLSPSAIRYYESEGLLASPARSSGRRVYDRAVLDRLALIEHAKKAGLTISEVRVLLSGFNAEASPAERWRELATEKMAELEARIAEAEQMKQLLERFTSCPCSTLDECGEAIRSSTKTATS